VNTIDADGKIITYHYLSGQLLSEIDEGENQVFALDVSRCDKNMVVTGGSDLSLRIYQGKPLVKECEIFTG